MAAGSRASADEQDYRFIHLVPGKDENTNTILKILRDRKGFMWFGTKMGLIRYDGYSFVNYKYTLNKPDWISGDLIRDFAVDRNGDLWLAIENGGLNHYQYAWNRFTVYRHRAGDSTALPTNEIFSVFPDSDGTVWFGARTGFYRFFPSEPRCQPVPLGPHLPQPQVMRIIRDQKGSLWLATRQHGLIAYNPQSGSYKIYQHQPGDLSSLITNQLWTVYEDRSGLIWIGSLEGGLDCLNPQTNVFTHYTHDPTNPSSISSNQVTAIYEDTRGTLWVGTMDRGLNRFDLGKKKFTRLTHDPGISQSLSSNSILCIFEDVTGTLWFGTYGTGVNMLFPIWKKIEFQSVMTFSFGKSLPFTVNKIIQMPDHTLLAGTNLGLAIYDTLLRRLVLFPTQGYRHPEAARYVTYTLHKKSNDSLWMGTELGLTLLDRKNRKFEIFQNPDLAAQDIETIAELPDRRLLINYFEQGASIFDPVHQSFHSLEQEKSLLKKFRGIRILEMLNEGDSLFWIGTNRRGLYLYRWQADELINYSVKPLDSFSISNNVIICLHRAQDGKLWIGTEGGLNIYDPLQNQFRVYREEDGLTDPIVNAIVPDTHGYYWIVSSGVVSRFHPATESFRNYDFTDGFPPGHFTSNASIRLNDGSILTGHEKGLIRFHPDEMKDNPFEPPVVLTGFRKFNREVFFDRNIVTLEKISLSYKDLLIAFDFAALSYPFPSKNRYAYRMEGFDENWNYTQNERTAVYTNLSPGNYVFRVKASNHDGVWNEEGLAVQVTITPPFWKTWWAYAFYILGSMSLIYAGMQWRSQSIRRRNRELAKKIEERTRELQHAQAKLIQSSKMASLGEMVAGLSHEINNPVTFITGNIENIRADIAKLIKSLTDEKQKNILQDMDQALQSSLFGARRIHDIVRNMKNFCKLDESEFKEINLHQELETILDLFFNQIKDIRFRRQYDEHLNKKQILCYASQMNQCFRNIIINAVQAIREAEKKNVLPPGSGIVEISTSLNQEEVKISFRDNGIGIPENIMDKIFDPFFTTREVGAGKGLGLTESYGIIQKHGGQINVVSQWHRGTEVILTLPLSPSKS